MSTYPIEFKQLEEQNAELRAEVEQLRNSMICLWCKKVLPKDEVKLTEHLLECKDHPLTRQIDKLQAESERLKELLREANRRFIAIQRDDELTGEVPEAVLLYAKCGQEEIEQALKGETK